MVSKNKEIKNRINLEYYYRHRERLLPQINKDSKERYHANKEVFLARAKASREKHYEVGMYRNTKSRALKLEIAFDLEVTDIVIPEKCPYLDIPLTRTQGKGRVWTNASLDRKDPSQGYVKGNIEVISLMANVMKNHASKDQLITFATNVLRRRDEEIKTYLQN